MTASALEVVEVCHQYGDRLALDHLTLSIPAQHIFGILGPNGSGKTTLFRLVATLSSLQRGAIRVLDTSVEERAKVRGLLGVVFQSPSLDGKLTVLENLRCQAVLYGLRGPIGKERIEESMSLFGISDRANDYCEKLSGGLKRRVELAKGILHRPRVMILDEPSVGLDPSARISLWRALEELQSRFGTSVILTTHLLEEAEKCHQLAIMHQGRLVAQGSPQALCQEEGQAMLSLDTANPLQLVQDLKDQFQLDASVVQNEVRIIRPDVADWVSPITRALGSSIHRVILGRPSLEDVFISRTGHRFWDDPIEEKSKQR